MYVGVYEIIIKTNQPSANTNWKMTLVGAPLNIQD